METLALAALDDDDLAIISAHLQDGLLKVKDMTWLQREKQFAFVINRFVWERALRQDNAVEYERRLTGMRVDRVEAVKTRGIDRTQGETVLSLLSLRFDLDSARPPSGAIVLTFAADKEIRLEVECLEAGMKDLGPAWATGSRPSHGDG